MGKALIIAEKPSVAAALSKALAKAPGVSRFTKNKKLETYENDTHIIAAAIGHLVELPLPKHDGKSLRWEIGNLPIMPDTFDLKPIDKTKKRFNLLKKLMKSKEVDLLVNACDAGREGELIFRYLVEAAGVKKPVKRLWMQSMTSQSLVDAFTRLRSDEEMLPLASAAKCRSESDWLVGINGSRALTAFNSRHGGFVLTPVGRVQTPTLAILVSREKEIRRFEPRTYYEIAADFEVAAGIYSSHWFREDFRKTEDPHHRAERLWDEGEARAIVDRCRGRKGTVEETRKPKKQSPPLLYDLTSLQRDASNRFGFSATRTLQAAQSLYEKHKALTYPRTDSRFLPEDYAGVVRNTLKALADAGEKAPRDLDAFARRALDEGRVKPGNRRIFNNARVSDHFAIIPTGIVPGARLSDGERKIYEAVTRRFVASFFDAAEFLITTRITRVESDAFRTSGKVLTAPGWLAVYGKEAREVQGNGDEGKVLVPIVQGEDARNTSMEAEEKKTKPPARYTEATLLSAMESAGKLVEDEELRAAMKERGLGTPATRAAIIEGLIKDKYVHREGRTLFATAKGIRLVDLLVERIRLDSLCSPELTGEWEYKLKEMEQGRLERDVFMKDIRTMTEDIVVKIKEAMKAPPPVLPDLDTRCPACGAAPMKQTEEHYSCSSAKCKFRLRKTVASRELAEEEARELMETGSVGPLEGFLNRSGEEFTTTLRLDEKFKVSFSYDNGARDGTELDNPIGPCPLCAKEGRSGQLHAAPDAYVCDQHFTEAKCPARLPRMLLRVQIPQEQALKFFNEGKTDVIENFISRKGRPFSASLVLGSGKDKLIEWNFPPSKRGSGKRARSRGAAKK
jgi:DNA topoisomerase-3